MLCAVVPSSQTTLNSVGHELAQMSFNSRVNSVVVSCQFDLIQYYVSKINSLHSGSLWLKLQKNSNSTNFTANWG